MNKQTLLFGAVAIAAGIAAIYLWQELQQQRRLTAEAQEISQSVSPGSQPSIGVQPTNAPPSVTPPEEAPSTPAAQTPAPPGQEFDHVLKDTRVARKHAAWQAESRDPEWAQATEDHWRNYFSGKPDLGSPTVECKSTICEMRVLVPGVNEEKLEEILKSSGSQPQKQEPNKESLMTFFGWTLDEQDRSTVGVLFATYTRTNLSAN